MGKRTAKIPALFMSVMLFVSGAFTLRSVQRQINAAEALLAQREAEERTLRREIELLRKGNTAEEERAQTERIARSTLGLLYPDEKVIIILGD